MLAVALAAGIAASAEPAWTVDLATTGVWPFLSDAGVVLLATEGEVVGLDAGDGTIRWRRPQRECVRADLFQPVPYTPYVLLSTYASGPDSFELVDARTGITTWTAPPGEGVLGVWPTGASALVLLDTSEEPGHLALIEVTLADGAVAWRVDDALHAPPPLAPARPGRTAAVTARATPGPLFVQDAVLTAWSPLDGVARRGPDGAVAWRLVVPGARRLLPADGYADLTVGDDTLWLPVRENRVAALDLATGAPRWKPSAGRVRGSVGHVLSAGDLVVVAGGDAIDALRATNGRSVWRVRLPTPVRDAVALGDGVVVLDADGVLYGLGPDGSSRFVRPLGDESAVLALDVVDDVVVARLPTGAVAVGADGTVRWRVVGDGAVPEPSPWDMAAGGARAGVLFREPPPADHPSRAEHVWTVVDRASGRSQIAVHRTDLHTGADASVALGSAHPRWMWDPRTGTVVVVSAGGRLDGIRLQAAPGGP